MGAAGRAEVVRHFDMAKQVVPFLEILREVAGRYARLANCCGRGVHDRTAHIGSRG